MQLLTESLVLCLLGGVIGVALGAVLLRLAAPLVAASLPITADLGVVLTWICAVLGFAAATLMAVLILTGLLPSLQTSFGKLSYALNEGSRGSSGSGAAVRRTIVIAEVAASVVLIGGAALLFKSLAKLQQVDAGVRIDHVTTMSVDLPSAAYPSPQSAATFYEAVVQRLQAISGVEQASVSQGLPLQGVEWGEYMSLPGVRDPLLVRLKLVDPWYFGALQIPVVTGRGIENRDRAGAAPVVVINQEVARQLSRILGIASPVGRTVGIDVPGYGPIPESLRKLRIVGIIRSERTSALNTPPELVAYLPLAQAPRQDIKLVVRTQIAPELAMPGIRDAVRQIDPNLPLGDVMTMEQVKQKSTLWARQPMWVIGAFAGVAALLAALGLYGVLAHAVTQQRREIGIRMAIGARSSDVLAHILRGAFSMLMVGLAAGLVGAVALTRVLKGLLFQVSALDPAALAVACVVMTVIGMTGSLDTSEPGGSCGSDDRCFATRADLRRLASPIR